MMASRAVPTAPPRCAARAWSRNDQLLLDPVPGSSAFPDSGLLIGMARRGAVILEKLSVSQFYFPLLRKAQLHVTGDGLFKNPRRLKPQTDAPSKQTKLNTPTKMILGVGLCPASSITPPFQPVNSQVPPIASVGRNAQTCDLPRAAAMVGA